MEHIRWRARMMRGNYFIKIFLYGIFIFLVSCKPVSKYGEQFLNAVSIEPAELSDVSISSNNSLANFAKTGDIITLNFSSSVELETYAAVIQGVPVTVNDLGELQYQAAYTVTGLEPEGLVDFKISYLDINNLEAEVFVTDDASSVTIKTTSLAPSSVTLKTPSSSPGLSATPEFTVSGVEDQAAVKLYSDACSTLVGTQVSSGDSGDITSSALTSGTYSFYAKQIDFLGNESTCSSASATYKKINQPFISTWRTTGPNEPITLPLREGFNYNMTVDWGDGSPEQEILSWDDPNITHTYASAGDYTITLTGICEAWFFANSGDKLKIISIENLGDMGWISFENAFSGTGNLTTVYGGNVSNVVNMERMFWTSSASPDTATWDTSSVASMFGMFASTSSANPDTSNWDTSSVTNMGSMFSSAAAANPETSAWDTSSVTNMAYMFSNADVADPDTSTWDTSQVINMANMFYSVDIANPNTSTWNTSNVLNMSGMFRYSTGINPDTSAWNTSKVTNMNGMFYSAYSAQPDTSSWITSSVTNMRDLFRLAIVADPDTSNWDTSNVTNMSGMFSAAYNAMPATSNWDTSKVTDMSGMFSSAAVANPNTLNWNTSNVTNMSGMFQSTSAANPNTSSWNISKVTNMSNMFRLATVANPDTSTWDTSKVNTMEYMFFQASAASPDISLWDVSSVTSMSNMLFGTSLPSAVYSDFLINAASQATQVNVPLNAGSSVYNINGATARDILIGRGWTITDGGPE